MALFPNQIPHGASNLRRSIRHSPRHTTQLPHLGNCRLHFPKSHQTKVFRLVVKTQLFDEFRIGFGTCAQYAVYLLCVHDDECTGTGLVGEYGCDFDAGREWCRCPGCCCCWRTLWSGCLVEGLKWDGICVLYFIGSTRSFVRVLVFYFFVHCNCRIFYTFI